MFIAKDPVQSLAMVIGHGYTSVVLFGPNGQGSGTLCTMKGLELLQVLM